MALKDCMKCGAENDATAEECGECGRSFGWDVTTDPDEGSVVVTLRDGSNEFRVSLEPADASQLARALGAEIAPAQVDRCTSPDSPEADDWPRVTDSDDPRWRDQIYRMVKEAVSMAKEGHRPTPDAVKKQLGVGLIADIAV